MGGSLREKPSDYRMVTTSGLDVTGPFFRADLAVVAAHKHG
jgi:hypothetical protein